MDSKGFKYSKSDVLARGRQNWRSIILALTGVAEKFLNGRQQDCPKCGGSDRFRVFDDFAETGGAFCNQCFSTKNGDGLAFLQWFNGWTFEHTIERTAEHLNIQPNASGGKKKTQKTAQAEKQPDKDPFEQWEPEQLTAAELRTVVEAWAKTKPGVDPEAVLQSSPMVGYWPKSGKGRQRVIGFTGYGFADGVSHPVALHIYRADGQQFPKIGYVVERKNHNVGGSKNGWLIVGGMQRFEAADVIWKVEGLTDAFALLHLLPLHHSVISMTNGAAWRAGSDRMPSLFVVKGRRVVVMGDADVPGQAGADLFAADAARVAAEVFVCRLPYAVQPVHGPDFRDWVCEDERLYDDLKPLMLELEFAQRAALRLVGHQRTAPLRTFDEDDSTDSGNAKHFAISGALRLRYLHAWKKWIYWDGKRWAVDDIGRSMTIAKEVAREVFDDAKGATFQAMKFAQKTLNASGLSNMVMLGRDELAIHVDELDTDQWLFNCANGTIDLRTGELFTHRQEDLHTKLSPITYDPAAGCPRWLQFLDEVFEGVEDIIPFLRRFFGYCLTGSVREQQFPVFWGKGSNGKSTLMGVVQGILGRDYAMQQKADLLIAKRNDPHPTELATMHGKRLVVMSETESDQRLAEAKVKALTGGEPIPCRRMNEDWWEFLPEFKLILVTNNPPKVYSQDFAMWRRLLMVPFLQRFEGARKDPDLVYRLQEESGGILAWMVSGCLEWQRDGLAAPESIVRATAEYAEKEDIVGRFMADCCILNAAATARASQIREAYEKWAADAAEPQNLSQKKVAAWLTDRGCTKFHSNGTVWRGVGLKHYDRAAGHAAAADGKPNEQPENGADDDIDWIDGKFQ